MSHNMNDMSRRRVPSWASFSQLPILKVIELYIEPSSGTRGGAMTANKNTVVIASLALFAMFFGAGNLIVPVMIGAHAGVNSWSAALGFVSTGVLLPVLSMVAMSTKRSREKRLADRLGVRLGLVVTTLIFLFTGMVYAIPRVGAVSYEMAIGPFVSAANPWANTITLLIYSALFFTAASVLVQRPAMVMKGVGAWLTPALLILLFVVIAGAWTLPVVDMKPDPNYAHAPITEGFIQGYFTMDALAAIMFGGVVIGGLKAAGLSKQQVHCGTAVAGLLAGIFLTIVYVGLVRVGQLGTGENGATLTAHVTRELFGPVGQGVFGLIVILACFTTAIGLLDASVEYFHELVPAITRSQWLLIAAVVSFSLTNLGLTRILAIVAPANQFLYPLVMVLVIVSLVDLLVPAQLYFAYRIPAWTTAVLALLEALYTTEIAVFAPLRVLLDSFPAGHLQMAWVVPATVAFLIGIGLDWRRLTKGC